jgi:prepilin-type N-terminal cleavage/methylation domain-containing protein/prepilin-type processing-associated H-X9-DG protein
MNSFLQRASGARHGRSSAFSLVELLVVIAIIAILAALIFPTLNAGKDSARRTQCASHLRQLGIAAQMYWDDNSGACFRFTSGYTNSGQLFWFGWLGFGDEGTRAFDRSSGVLFPYLQAKGVELCPALNVAMAQFKLKALGAAYGYGYNLHLSSAPKMQPQRISRATNPSGLALFADAAQVNTFQPPASVENPLLEEFYYVSTNRTEATVHFRHTSRANVVFCDGHTVTEKPEAGSLDARLPGQRIGRLNASVLTP